MVCFELTSLWPEYVPLKICFLQKRSWSTVHTKLRATELPRWLREWTWGEQCFHLLSAFPSLLIFIHLDKVNWVHKHTQAFLLSAPLHIQTAPHDSSGSTSVYFKCTFYSLQVHRSRRSGLSDLLKGSRAVFDGDGCNSYSYYCIHVAATNMTSLVSTGFPFMLYLVNECHS